MTINEEKLARALSASARRQILTYLQKKERGVGEIAQHIGQSLSITSRHLKLLYDLGFLNTRRQAQKRFYSLKHDEMKDLLGAFKKVVDKL